MTNLESLEDIINGRDSLFAGLWIFLAGDDGQDVEMIIGDLNANLSSDFINLCREELYDAMFGELEVDFLKVDKIKSDFDRNERTCLELISYFEPFKHTPPDYAKFDYYIELIIALNPLFNLFVWFKNAYANLNELEKGIPANYSDFGITLQDEPSSTPNNFTIKEVAMFCVFQRIIVTPQNMNEIVEKYGHRSGKALHNNYCNFSHKSERIGVPPNESKVTLRNRIKLYENVMKFLEPKYREEANEELTILKKRYNSNY